MSFDQMISTIESLSVSERETVLAQISQMLHGYPSAQEVQHNNGSAIVEQTWGSIRIDARLARWIAQDAEIEYEPV